MTNIISDVSVGKISLVTSEHNPAVPKATGKFAIFKFFQRKKVSKTAIENIQKIQRAIKIDEIKL